MPRTICYDETCGDENASKLSGYALFGLVVLALAAMTALMANNAAFIGNEVLNNPLFFY
jgi:hypothetical protein